MNVITKEVQVTPDVAHAWLDEHYKRLEAGTFLQRPVTTSVVNRYAADMAQGAWLLCPQPICFDEAGNLLDGQHRLEAVRKSKQTIRVMLSTGWPATGNGRLTTIDVIDRGRTRSVANQLYMHGYKHANNYAACVATMARLAHHAGSTATTFAGTLSILDQLDMRSHIDRIMTKSQSTKDFNGRVVGVLAYYHTTAPRKAEEFADNAFNFTAVKGSPVQNYLKWVKMNTGRRTDDHLKALCACLRAWHDNINIASVRLNIEAAAWLAATNPRLRDHIRLVMPRTT